MPWNYSKLFGINQTLSRVGYDVRVLVRIEKPSTQFDSRNVDPLPFEFPAFSFIQPFPICNFSDFGWPRSRHHAKHCMHARDMCSKTNTDAQRQRWIDARTVFVAYESGRIRKMQPVLLCTQIHARNCAQFPYSVSLSVHSNSTHTGHSLNRPLPISPLDTTRKKLKHLREKIFSNFTISFFAWTFQRSSCTFGQNFPFWLMQCIRACVRYMCLSVVVCVAAMRTNTIASNRMHCAVDRVVCRTKTPFSTATNDTRTRTHTQPPPVEWAHTIMHINIMPPVVRMSG